MAYITEKPRHEGSKSMEAVVDVQAFARDLATALGGRYVEPAPDAYRDLAKVMVGADMLTVSADCYRTKDKTFVHVRVSAPEIPHTDLNVYEKSHKTESASVKPDARPMEVIARDIKRRVLDASQEALALQRGYAAAQAERRGATQSHYVKFIDAVKPTKTTLADDKMSASFYIEKPYISGRVDCKGRVRVETLPDMTLEQFQKFTAIFGGSDGDAA